MITDETPIAMLTVKDLREILKKDEPIVKKSLSDKKYVYGLRGIRDIFRVSHATAQRYKDTILKDAVTQHGRKIITDVDKAIELFNKTKY